MTEPRLKTAIWVQALVRQVEVAGATAIVLRKGDGDGGAVLLKLTDRATCTVLAQTHDPAGGRAWIKGTGPTPVDDATADAYIARAWARDPDLWVVEIDDPKRRFAFSGRVL